MLFRSQELITRYDRLIIIDATTRGGVPGTVYSLIIDRVLPTREIDMHTAVPSRALEVAQAFGPLPGEIYLVGCEPGSVDELTTDLSAPVAAAVDDAVRRVEALLRQEFAPANATPAANVQAAVTGAGSDIAREDELLELLYWFEGEGFGGVASMEGIDRKSVV